MPRRSSNKTLVAMLAASLLASPIVSSTASAQEAITLEAIGAVRMLPPADVQRLDEQPEAADALWFSDAYATAYYKVNCNTHELTVRIEQGPKGGNPLVIRRKVGEGSVESVSLLGTGTNNIRATLTVRQKAGCVSTYVKTEKTPEQQASN